MAKIGRPGEDRAKQGRLRGQVHPDLKREVEELVKRCPIFRSVSQVTELALKYFIHDFKQANELLDRRGFPALENSQKPCCAVQGDKTLETRDPQGLS